jgi:phage terminase large subunit-like protein
MTRGERVCAFIERYCRVPEGDLLGRPIKLEPFQRKFILAVYDNPAGTRRGYLSMARKNGKTATIACILLAHIAGPEAVQNSRIVSGAMSRDQAAEVYNYASKTIELSPDLRRLTKIVPSGKKIRGLKRNVEYVAISAEGKTAHGKSPVLAILDEVGQIRGPQSDFVDAITTAQGAYLHPLLLAISTQAPSDSDLFSIWLDDALESKDPRIVCHLYAAKKDCDVLDRAEWAAANPALGVFRSLADIEEQADRANRMPSAKNMFRNLGLNQRVETSNPFVSRDVWLSCAGPVLDFGSAPVWAGLDLSKRTDLTSLILIGKVAGTWHVRSHFWTPEDGLIERSKRDRSPYDVWARQGYLHTTPGATVDYEYVAQDMAAIFAGLDVRAVAYDQYRMDVLQKELDRIGATFPLVPFRQGTASMGPAIDALEAEMLNGRIAHGGHPVLTMCAANVLVTQDATGNRKFDKKKSTGRIDGMVSLAMAFGAADTKETTGVSWWESAANA